MRNQKQIHHRKSRRTNQSSQGRLYSYKKRLRQEQKARTIRVGIEESELLADIGDTIGPVATTEFGVEHETVICTSIRSKRLECISNVAVESFRNCIREDEQNSLGNTVGVGATVIRIAVLVHFKDQVRGRT